MQQPQQPQQNQGLTLRGSVNLLYLLASAHATCLTVFMRHSFGVEALGIDGVAALVVMVLYTSFTSSQAMVNFLGIWLLALVAQQVMTFWRTRRGWVQHSQYGGYPWLGLMVPFVRRVEAAKVWEMIFCMVAGAMLCTVDEALGQFVLLGLFSLLFKAGIEGEINRKRLQRMRDAEIEMRHVVNHWNQRNF